MPTVLDAGTVTLSNADVLDWVKSKREQHAKEDAVDKEAGRTTAHRPTNFMSSLRKHERELSDAKYPYTANPGAFEGSNRNNSVAVFVERCDEEICYPLEEKYTGQGLTIKELRNRLGKEQEKKSFTSTELLMIQNLAPENVSMLEMMLDGWQERFTMEEMEKIVLVIEEVFHCRDKIPMARSDQQQT